MRATSPESSELLPEHEQDLRMYEFFLNDLSDDEVAQMLDFLMSTGEHSTQSNQMYEKMTGEAVDYNEMSYSSITGMAFANGVENTIGFVGSLFTSQGRQDVWDSVFSLNEMPATLKVVWDLFYERLSEKQKLAVSVEFGVSGLALGGGISVIPKLLKLATVLKKVAIVQSVPSSVGTATGVVAPRTIKGAESMADIGEATELSNQT